MKENSIEETIKQLKLMLKVRKEQKEIIECAGGSCMNCNPDIKALTESIEILSDYKRVLKENEEKNKIKEQKECTFREYGAEEGLWYCSNCHDEWLFYEGTPEENNLKYCPHCGAKVTKYENYIEGEIEVANKMEEDLIEKLQKENEQLKKENEELKNQEATQRKINELLVQRYSNSISVQKLKDKIEKLKEKEESDFRSYGFAVEVHLALQVLQELLEGRK